MNGQYLALLRGINVGGNNLIKMSALKDALEQDGFTSVRTYIQSGNVIFHSDASDTDKLAKQIEASIKSHFDLDVGVVVFSKAEWQEIIDSAPDWWGKDENWKHNLLVLLKPYDMKQAVEAIGELKPEMEAMEPGNGILYQSVSIKLFGRATTGKLASMPIYKKMTIRNYNTATRLSTLLD
jgi:uncharacterized protein (DUF1697 family)